MIIPVLVSYRNFVATSCSRSSRSFLALCNQYNIGIDGIRMVEKDSWIASLMRGWLWRWERSLDAMVTVWIYFPSALPTSLLLLQLLPAKTTPLQALTRSGTVQSDDGQRSRKFRRRNRRCTKECQNEREVHGRINGGKRRRRRHLSKWHPCNWGHFTWSKDVRTNGWRYYWNRLYVRLEL